VKLRSWAAAAALLIVYGQSTAADGEGFPGTGSQSDWSDALPYYNLANKHLQSEHYDAAVRRYKEAISHYQFDPDFFVNLGVADRKLGDFPAAEEAFKSAIKLNEKDWMPWSDLANVYLKQDKLQEAVKTFERTLKYGPPPAEKAAIQQDIKDINKILSMQQPKPASKADAAQSAGLPKSGEQKNNPHPHVLPKTSTTPAASAQTGRADSHANLQGTGWDYVYPGAH
jgi:tetratricopeptide (TPR) repeat protein